MIITNGTGDSTFGGMGITPVEPRDRKGYTIYPKVEIGQFSLRFMTLRLEYMSKWFQHHRDISRFINPKRGWFEGFVPNYNAQIDYRLIIDGTPQRAVRTFAAGMCSGLTSPSRPWFRLGFKDKGLSKYGPVRAWLDIVHNVLMDIFQASNIYQAFHQNYEELGMFGTGAYAIYEDFHSVLRARSYTVGEYFLGYDYCGRLNAFARQFFMTVDQIVNEYGWENCSDKCKNAYQAGQRDTYLLVYQLVEENTTKVDGREDFTGKKYRSVTWEAESKFDKCLRMGGFNEMPVIGTRWDVVTTADSYGIGPGWYGLGDIKTLYRMKKDILLGLNKMVDPPVVVDANVVGNANLLPGGITRRSAQTQNPGASPAYQVNIPLKEAYEALGMVKQDVNSWFYADLFAMMLNGEPSEMTAREVAERHDEKLLMLGPALERVFSEMLNPTIDRAFAIALRSGLLPPPPPVIQGMKIDVEYISLLAQAQKIVGVATIEQTATFAGRMVSVYPEVKDVLDADEALREYADMAGAPEKMLRSQEDVQKIRADRAAQAKAAQDAQSAMAAVQAAKVLSETQVGGANAAEHILGIQPSGGV